MKSKMRATEGTWHADQWSLESGVGENVVASMAGKGAITGFHILEHVSKTFYVTLTCSSRTDVLYLNTTRDPGEPKLFKDLDRLCAFIKKEFPTVRDIALTLNRRSVDNRNVKVKVERRGARRKATPVTTKKRA